MKNDKFGIKVLTWGSENSTIYNAVHGYNVGHASVEIIMPISAETTQYIDTYIKGTEIPIEKCATQGCYKVYVSVWPQEMDENEEEDKKFFSNLPEDYLDERSGAPVEIRSKTKEKFKDRDDSEEELHSILVERAKRPHRSLLDKAMGRKRREVVIAPLKALKVSREHYNQPIYYKKNDETTLTTVGDAAKLYIELQRAEELMQSEILSIQRTELLALKEALLNAFIHNVKQEDKKEKILSKINKVFGDLKSNRDLEAGDTEVFVTQLEIVLQKLTKDEKGDSQKFLDGIKMHHLSTLTKVKREVADTLEKELNDFFSMRDIDSEAKQEAVVKLQACFSRFHAKSYTKDNSYTVLREEVLALIAELPVDIRTDAQEQYTRRLATLKSEMVSERANRSVMHRLYSLVGRREKINNSIETIREALTDFGFEQYCLIGKEPDHVTKLPLNVLGNEQGLDLEAILKEARALHDEEEGFSLYDKNCSRAASRLLLAGLEKNAVLMKESRIKKLASKLNRMLNAPEEQSSGIFKRPREKITKIMQIFDKDLSYEKFMKLFSPSQVNEDAKIIKQEREQRRIVQMFLKLVLMIKRALSLGPKTSRDNIFILIDKEQYEQVCLEIKALPQEDFANDAKRERLFAYILNNVKDDSCITMFKLITSGTKFQGDYQKKQFVSNLIRSTMIMRPEMVSRLITALGLSDADILDDKDSMCLFEEAILSQNGTVIEAFLEKLKDVDSAVKEDIVSTSLEQLFKLEGDYTGLSINYSYEFLLALYPYAKDQKTKIIEELMPMLKVATATNNYGQINSFISNCKDKGIVSEVLHKYFVKLVEFSGAKEDKQLENNVCSMLHNMAKLQQVEESVLEELAGFLDYCERNILHVEGEIKLIGCEMLGGAESKEFRVPVGVNIISFGAFYRATYSSVILPNSINLVDKGAFSNMSNLESLRLPVGVKLRKQAILNCKKLKSIYISPNSKLGETFIKGCSALEEIIVEGSAGFHKKAFKYIPESVRIIAIDEAAKESVLRTYPHFASRVEVAGKAAKAYTSGINISGYSGDMTSLDYEGVRTLLNENKRANKYYHNVAKIHGEVDDAAIKAVYDRFTEDKLEVYLPKESSMLEMSEILLALQSSPKISLWSYGQEEDLAILDMLALYGDYLESYQLSKTIVLTLSDGVTRVIPLKELKGELEELEDYHNTLSERKALNALGELDEYLAQENLDDVEKVVGLPTSARDSEALRNEHEGDKQKNSSYAAAIWSKIINYIQSIFQSIFGKKPEEELSLDLNIPEYNGLGTATTDPQLAQAEGLERAPDAVTIVCGGDALSVEDGLSLEQAELLEAHYRSYNAIRALYHDSKACKTYVDEAIAGEEGVESRQQYVHRQYDQVKRSIHLESKHCKSVEFCEAFLMLNNPKLIKIVSHGESEDKALIDALLLYQRYVNDAKLDMTHRVKVTFSDKAQIDLTLDNLGQLKELKSGATRDGARMFGKR